MQGCRLPDESADPWSDQHLLQTVAGYAGAGADADQPEEVRFLRGVAGLVKKRRQRELEGETAVEPAVFLLCPTEPQTIDRMLLKSHPMLDNGLTPVAGRLWLVGPVVVSGKSMPLDTREDNAFFEFVVNDLKQGEVATVIYDPRADPMHIRYYPAGLQNVDTCEIIDISVKAPINIRRILDIVDQVCKKQLITPDAQSQMGKLWKDSSRHWVARDAELIIQMYLVTALFAALPSCVIRWEQSQATGRLDIEIEEPDPSRPAYTIRHAILELKVLRSFGSTGRAFTVTKVREWVSKGVDQAYAYRIDKGSLQSSLCCFDMRKSHADMSAFEEVADKATRLDVTVQRWCLYASAEDYRTFLAQLN
jgi:hypothetical protein